MAANIIWFVTGYFIGNLRVIRASYVSISVKGVFITWTKRYTKGVPFPSKCLQKGKELELGTKPSSKKLCKYPQDFTWNKLHSA